MFQDSMWESFLTFPCTATKTQCSKDSSGCKYEKNPRKTNTFGSWTPYEENVNSIVLREMLFSLEAGGMYLATNSPTV